MTAMISLNPPWPIAPAPILPPDPLPIRFMPTGQGERGWAMFAVGKFRHVTKPSVAPKVPEKRRRRPSLKRLIAVAERSGKIVTSITTPDGVTLQFGKVEDAEGSNPWLADLDKVTKQ